MRYLVAFVFVLTLGVVGCSETAGAGGSGGSGGSAGTGGGATGTDGFCVDTPIRCANGSIDATIESCDPALATPPIADVCRGTESLRNPASCTRAGTTLTVDLTQIEIDGDCNSGFDLDGCNGTTCALGGIASGEGVDGVDNGLAGLAPILLGLGGNHGTLNQAFYNAICEGELAIGLRIDANTAESCATVEILDGGTLRSTVTLNLSTAGCLSGTLGTIPFKLTHSPPATMSNAVLRATLSAGGISNGALGATADADTASMLADYLVSGGADPIGHGILDINDDLSVDASSDCTALSMTLLIGGVVQQ